MSASMGRGESFILSDMKAATAHFRVQVLAIMTGYEEDDGHNLRVSTATTKAGKIRPPCSYPSDMLAIKP